MLFHGFALKKAGRFEWAHNFLVKEHDSHKTWLTQVLGKAFEEPQNFDIEDIDIDDPLLADEEPQIVTSAPKQFNIEAEWDTYAAMPINKKDVIKESCLAWWKVNQVKFPLLAECAQKWLCPGQFSYIRAGFLGRRTNRQL